MTRVLLRCVDIVGKSMAGPAIRYWEMAHALSKKHQVTLATPNETDLRSDHFEIFSYSNKTPAECLKNIDAIISQNIDLKTAIFAKKHNIKIIIDAYAPGLLENQEIFKNCSLEARSINNQRKLNDQNLFFKLADGVICASEKQRDLWIGTLMALDAITPQVYDADPTLRNLIDVVPFGLSSTLPKKSGQGLKDKFSLKPTDKVVLWGGGIWNWFDPLSLIKAIKILSLERSDVKLVFMGIKHPNDAIGEMEMTQKAIRLVQKLDLLDSSVFFNYGWTPYQERQNYLLDADIGVSTHFDHLETRFSFRTRIMDYIWAQLPILCTQGDSFADLVKSHHLGVVVPYQDERAIAEGIKKMIDHPEVVQEIKANLAKFHYFFAWENVVKPIEAMLYNHSATAPRQLSGYENKLLFGYIMSQLSLKRQEVGVLKTVGVVLVKLCKKVFYFFPKLTHKALKGWAFVTHKLRPLASNKFKESRLAHQLLDGLKGVEIGGSAHNPFGLNSLNVDYTKDQNTVFKKYEVKMCGECLKVDIEAPGNQLPFDNNSIDFVISSHVIEHFYDPIQAIKEWLRVVKPGGYVYIIAPHKDRTFDKDRPVTSVAELVERHTYPNPPEVDEHIHYSVWRTQDFVDLCTYYQWRVVAVQDVDDKVGNGFAVVIKK